MGKYDENIDASLPEIDLEEYKEKIENSMPDFLAVAFKQVELPEPKIDRKNDWVLLGENNSFFTTLIESTKLSPIHNSAVRYKASLYGGESYRIINQSDITPKEIREVDQYLSNINNYGESLIEVLQKFCLDASLTGNAYLQVIWNKGRNRIVELHHAHANCFAPAKVNDRGRIDRYFFSPDWTNTRKFEPESINVFNKSNPGGKQIIPFRLNETTGNLYFGEPDYLSALTLIELQDEIGNFWLNYIRRGMFATILVNLPSGIPKTDEQKRKIERQWASMFEGANRKHTMLNFINSKENAAMIQQLSNSADLDKAFTVVQQIASEGICTAHKITNKRIFGISTGEAALGQQDELKYSFQILMNTTIYPVQIRIEKIINEILSINGWNAKIELVDATPIEFLFQEPLLEKILSKSELRQRINYPTIEESTSPSPAQILGVGGTQAFQNILVDQTLTNEQKYAILINFFKINEDEAKQMINGKPLE